MTWFEVFLNIWPVLAATGVALCIVTHLVAMMVLWSEFSRWRWGVLALFPVTLTVCLTTLFWLEEVSA